MLLGILFFLCSNAFFYIPIIHLDLNISMWLAIGMYCASVLAFPRKKPANVKSFQPVWLALLGGSAIGVGVYEKLPLAFFLLGSSVLLVARSRREEAMVCTMAALTVFSILTSVNLAQDGNFSAYKGQRFSYLDKYPFELSLSH
jgi:hypothetical protein